MNLSGNPVDYLVAFLGGVLLSFTPCVYPLIPISVSYIGVRAGQDKFKGFTLSLAYVTGIAVTYSLLGLLASLSGGIFGAISAKPVTHIFTGIVIIIFGISMLDIFTISLPNIIRLPKIKTGDYLSVFFLGLSSGLIIGPCLTPVLGAILVYLTTKRDIIYGATLLFIFAYGMGLLLIVSGTFSAMLVNLPKSGKWLVYIKRACAFILIGMGIYFMSVGIRRI